MAKKVSRSTDITHVQAAQVPAYLAEYKSEGTDLVEGFILIPRIKIIQGMTDSTLRKKTGEGAAVLMPAEEVLAQQGDTFTFTTLFFWVDWTEVSDLNDQDSPIIMSRTFDPNSDLARRAQSPDPDIRAQKYGPNDKFTARATENLRFAVMVDTPDGVQPALLTFTRGERTRTGKKLCTLIKMRRAPIWSQVFEATPAEHSNGQHSWFGLDISPAGFIAEEQVAEFRDQFERFQEDHRRVAVEDDDAKDEQSAEEEAEY
jgi:hypothetical protein